MTKKYGNELDRSALDRLPVHPGLCASCVHLRLLTSKTSVFARCGKADEDERFPRYPPLPVLECEGYAESGSRSHPGVRRPSPRTP